jgi:bla regulator protein blaR1
MTHVPQLQWLASAMLDRMVFSLVAGTLFAALVTLVLRLGAGRNSQTRFVVWFSALSATALLPLLLVRWPETVSSRLEQDAVTVPATAVTYFLISWMVIAFAGLVRVVAGLWQLRRTRLQCEVLQVERLPLSIQQRVEGFRAERNLELLVSEQMHMPAAIGFLRPAIILPRWMLEEASIQELEHVVLHELAHLRRRDDWTNLAQKVLKAVFFFHPAVWWLERKLAIDRELACDDEVLAQTENPRVYAESLTRIAQKSFLRRQLALAQAALGRFLPLSARVKRILTSEASQSRTVWKPAVPVVVGLALLSGFGVSWTPDLIKVENGATSTSVAHLSNAPEQKLFVPASVTKAAEARAWQADLRTAGNSLAVTGRDVNRSEKPSRLRSTDVRTPRRRSGATVLQAKHTQAVPEKGFVLLIATERQVTATPTGWEVKVSQVRLLIPASNFQKQIPRKT